GVANLEAAVAAYELLLGVPAVALPNGGRRLQLARGAVELESGMPGVHSIAFVAAADSPVRTATAEAFNGIHVRADALAPASLPDAATVPAIDRFGVRLALDREFPERGLRLLFFRSGGITLEYACALAPSAGEGSDRFHGV